MEVKFFAYIRDYTKCKETNIACEETVEKLLLKLSEMYGDQFRSKVFSGNELSKEIIVLVNGRHIVHLDGINTKLENDDVVSIFPVVAGG
jgi:sulfur-carrier protein